MVDEDDQDDVRPETSKYSFLNIGDIAQKEITKVASFTTKTQKEFNEKYNLELSKILLPASIDMSFQDIKISFSNEIREIDGIFLLFK